jgi:hypothetical protein
MADLTIDLLRLRVENGAGHEHRLGPVARQAAAILADRLAERLATGPSAVPSRAAHLVAAPVSLSLAGMSDAAAAERIASAWLTALTIGSNTERVAGPARTRP